MSTVVLYCWCHSDSASFVFFYIEIQKVTSTKLYTPFKVRFSLRIWTICVFQTILNTDIFYVLKRSDNKRVNAIIFQTLCGETKKTRKKDFGHF